MDTPVVARAVRSALGAHRAEQIEHLHEYGARGEFPHNTTAAPAHIFRDAEGRLCGVANLLETDGRADLVEATVQSHNDLAIADVHDGPIEDWIVGSGLTQEELVRVQLPAPVMIAPRRASKSAAPKSGAPAVAANEPSPEEAMKAAVVRHVAEVEAELRASTERSLDVAVARYMERTYGPTAARDELSAM